MVKKKSSETTSDRVLTFSLPESNLASHDGALPSEPVDEILMCDIQIKAFEQFFPRYGYSL